MSQRLRTLRTLKAYESDNDIYVDRETIIAIRPIRMVTDGQRYGREVHVVIGSELILSSGNVLRVANLPEEARKIAEGW